MKGQLKHAAATDALDGYKSRFPTWMWRNADMLDFVSWLRDHNTLHVKDPSRMVGVYGLDLYSLFTSIQAVLEYLKPRDPAAARMVAQRYSCFGHYHEDPQAYGQSAAFGLSPSCEREAVQVLTALQRRRMELMTSAPPQQEAAGAGSGRGSGAGSSSSSGNHHRRDLEETFYAELQAQTICDAERYYTEMFRGRVNRLVLSPAWKHLTVASVLRLAQSATVVVCSLLSYIVFFSSTIASVFPAFRSLVCSAGTCAISTWPGCCSHC